ncbi:MAG: T9SS type A sorting domain-containing protein, partial [candidate division Zixibacteria bacterium]|nr:T9SS type A sorting domain-containing protein [candidate division Zixibacteria bacterium]
DGARTIFLTSVNNELGTVEIACSRLDSDSPTVSKGGILATVTVKQIGYSVSKQVTVRYRIWDSQATMVATGRSYIPLSSKQSATGSFQCFRNYPNPFNSCCQIEFEIASATHITLEVLNILGQSVRTLVDGYKSAGNYSVVWDGRDNSQQSVASGIYLYRIVAGDFSETHKMILMK